MGFSGEVADCQPTEHPSLTLPYSGHLKSPSLEPVFGLSVLGYYRNMAATSQTMWKMMNVIFNCQ